MPYSDAPIPGFRIPDLPQVDLGFPLRHSSKAREGAGEVVKGVYVAGGIQGYSIGQTVGYAAGEMIGYIKGSFIASLFFATILFCHLVFKRLPSR